MKKSSFYIIWLVGLSVSCVLFWKFFTVTAVVENPDVFLSDVIPEEAAVNEPIQPIPLRIQSHEKKEALGGRLFHDARLSRDNTVSCASCHNLTRGGSDQLAVSKGISGSLGDVNAPTVWNSRFNVKQFWDGRAETLEDQVDGPTHNALEMGSSWPEIIGKLQQDEHYAASFKQIYPDGITHANIKDAIAAFERSLVTPNGRFDQYLRGNQNALSEEEKKGYRTFKSIGCVVCHQGVNVGSNMFQTLGKFGNYFADRGNETKADLGRFNATGNEKDRYKLKVPTLRNVELTAPYFHDGSQRALKDAVLTMAKYQLGRTLSDEEADSIVAFLKTLTGEYAGTPLGPSSS